MEILDESFWEDSSWKCKVERWVTWAAVRPYFWKRPVSFLNYVFTEHCDMAAASNPVAPKSR